MTPGAAGRAASLLLKARRDRNPLSGLPAECRPETLEEAYQIQDAFSDQAGREKVGYKIGATSQKAQDYLSVEHPFAGRVLTGDLHDSPVDLAADGFPFRLIEPEFAFCMATGLPYRTRPYERPEVAAAVAALHPAIEIVTSAFADWHRQGAMSLVADNGVNGALILGPPTEQWRLFDLAEHAVRLSLNGKPVGEGTGANALGHPLNALLWLANFLIGRGEALMQGDIVTTGVVTPFIELESGDRARADFGSLGEVSIAFS